MELDVLELAFIGETVRPDVVRAGEIARLILGLEEAILSVVQDDLLTPEPVELHFIKLVSSSLHVHLTSRSPSAYEAYTILASTVQAATYDRLPDAAVKGLRALQAFSQAHNCPVEFRRPQVSSEPLAILTPGSAIRLRPRVSGVTTIYGEIIRLGGRIPRVRLKLLNGQELSCKAPKSLVQQLGNSVYRIVGLAGRAQWETEHFSLIAFEVETIVPYDDRISDPTADLAQQFGHYFTVISDVPAAVRVFRDDESSG